MDYPPRIRREIVNRLLAEELILNDPENRRAVWFHIVLTFSKGQCSCWQVLWTNFLRGNLPLRQERILSAWGGESLSLSDVYKRHSVWRNIIVGDGRGNFWLRVPPDFDLGLTQMSPVPSTEGDTASSPVG